MESDSKQTKRNDRWGTLLNEAKSLSDSVARHKPYGHAWTLSLIFFSIFKSRRFHLQHLPKRVYQSGTHQAMRIIGAFFALAMLSGSLALETTSAATTNEEEVRKLAVWPWSALHWYKLLTSSFYRFYS
jgi:hypothetical protein